MGQFGQDESALFRRTQDVGGVLSMEHAGVGVEDGVAAVAVKAIEVGAETVDQGSEVAFDKCYAGGAVLGWDFVAEKNDLGCVGIGLVDLKAGLAQAAAEGDATINEAADDGALAGEEAANSHAGEFELEETPCAAAGSAVAAGAGGLKAMNAGGETKGGLRWLSFRVGGPGQVREARRRA